MNPESSFPLYGRKPLFMVAFRLDIMALKSTSSPIVISTGFQTTSGTFAVQPVDLQLNPLDMEVFVVTAVKVDFDALPYAVAIPDTTVLARYRVSVCKSRPPTMQTLADSNCIASDQISGLWTFDSASNPRGVSVTQQSPMDTPPSQLDYLDIIATDSFFIGIDGLNTTGGADGAVRLFGYRARADAATYAALVQSEMLSN